MKISLSRLLAVACAALISATAAESQIMIGVESDPLGDDHGRGRILVGPTLGINRNYHSGGFRVLDESRCPLFESGSGVGYLFGVTAEFQHNYWSLIPRVTYESRPGDFHARLEDAPVFIPDEGISVTQSVETESVVEYKILNAEVMFKHDVLVVGRKGGSGTKKIAARVALAGGPAVAYVLDGKVSQYQKLIEPKNAQFLPVDPFPLEDGGRTIVFARDMDIPGRNALRFSLKAGIQGEIGLYDNAVMMSPGIFYDYGLSNVTSNENWDLNTLLFQVDFRFAFF